MDVPQMHVYEFTQDPIEAAARMAMWTETMWNREEKPNWIGEYGEEGPQFYPELFHNSNWASLGAGGGDDADRVKRRFRFRPIHTRDGSGHVPAGGIC